MSEGSGQLSNTSQKKVAKTNLLRVSSAWNKSSRNPKQVKNFKINSSKLTVENMCKIIGLSNLESLLDGQIEGLDWLDSVDQLLDYYEDDSRTEAFSGFVID